MAWSAPIWFDLWLAGMAGGAYFTGFVVDRFSGGGNRRLLRLGAYLGIPLAVIGVILLVAELGHPLRFWHLFTQFKVISPMSMGTWILLAWVSIAVIMVILWWVENRLAEETVRNLRRTIGVLAWIDAVLAVLLICYTGALLAVSNQSLWAGTVLLPSLFIASAISTGVAILIITAIIANALFGPTNWAIPTGTIRSLAKALAVVISIELAVLIGHIIWLAASSMASAGEALKTLISGGVAIPFWAGVVILALLVPFGLLVANWRKEIETKAVRNTIIVSSACVILGGLILRAVIVIGGQF